MQKIETLRWEARQLLAFLCGEAKAFLRFGELRPSGTLDRSPTWKNKPFFILTMEKDITHTLILAHLETQSTTNND